MRLVVQRVTSASVSWQSADGATERRAIAAGLAILVGAGAEDSQEHVVRLAEKVATLRIFADEQRRSNLSLGDVGGSALVVSQFTLYAELARGRRPSFINAGEPKRAEELCESFAAALENRGINVQRGSFGAHMKVELVNDGPVTFALSTDDWETRI